MDVEFLKSWRLVFTFLLKLLGEYEPINGA